MAEEGVRESEAGSDLPPMVLEVRKQAGAAVHYSLSVEGETIASFDLEVAAEKDGAATRLSADLDLDRSALARLAGPDGESFPAVPDSLINIGLSKMLGEMAADIEAGRPLPAMGPAQLAGWNAPGAAERRATGEQSQAAAAAPTIPQPTASAAPMVDPDAEARKYLNGGN